MVPAELKCNLDIVSLHDAYRNGGISPRALVTDLLTVIRNDQRAAWISVPDDSAIDGYLRRIEQSSIDLLPLYGIPFAIKDNIDLAGLPTTAACPEFGYMPARSAHVVERLLEAGAIPLGKTNMDQFATGLVGTRSPYGVCKNPFDSGYIAGGSSAGSAVSVAAGQVSFALGTDTAGSGRMPAAFNNIVGLKPTCGALSNRGVVPACRSLDCVSVFALNCADAATVLSVTAAYDDSDPFSRPVEFSMARTTGVIGIPREDQLRFFGNDEYARLFSETIDTLRALGFAVRELDITVLLDAARLLYEGPWVAERTLAVENLLREKPEALWPVTREIIQSGFKATAMEAFSAQYRLQGDRRETQRLFRECDVLLLPTAGTIYKIAEVEAEPVTLNGNLGYYTNFMNLLDLCAVAVPAGFTGNGLPFGVTLCAPATEDYRLLLLADRLQRARVELAGTAQVLPDRPVKTPTHGFIKLAVCGAHLSGLPLNGQLTERNAVLRERTTTANCYRLYALAGGPPYRPGLVRDTQGGTAIEVEVWEMPARNVGEFVAGIPAPLGIGKLELSSGEWVNGFICEPCGIGGAREITEFGGWRRYIQQSAA